ncbi:mediator complex subunit 11 [Amblyomma americanum]|uniref:Mediator of RNA polymerase II transcription subunit 11 n=1 Tax=Amblyomma americanum TaxID=6943 RepID=A0A0C9SAJ6_AMBAM
MNSMTTLKMKLKELEEIEKEVAAALQSAGQACLELSREKPSMKQVESHTSSFLTTLQNVEAALTKHILYLTQVSTVQPHEGSSYAAQKVFHMALHRLEHARSRMNELERLRHQQQQEQPPQQPPLQQQIQQPQQEQDS